MRTALALVMLASLTATADPIDLEKDPEGAARLAESAGACDKAQPAFVRTWCNASKPRRARFVQRYVLQGSARSVANLISVTVPISEAGKGFIPSAVMPTIWCDAQACLYSDAATIVIRASSQLPLAEIASITLTFDTAGLWQVRQWWGPRAANATVTFWTKDGKQLGDGVLLAPTPK